MATLGSTDLLEQETPEVERLRRRQEVRLKLARLDLVLSKAADIRAAIRAVEGRCDELAAEHAAEMRPLQDELEAVEGRIIQALAKRQTATTKDDNRRRELLRLVHEANGKLERALGDEKSLLPSLRRELRKLESEAAERQATENSLCLKYGNPSLLATKQAADSAVTWSRRRLDYARDKLAENQSRHRYALLEANPTAASTYQQRVFRWQTEVAAAEAALAAAVADADAAFRRVLDE